MKGSLIFSGIQPTGRLHIGNYLGAVKTWVSLQRNGEHTVISVADLHAMTAVDVSSRASDSLHVRSLETARSVLACGYSSEKGILYRQSALSGAHTTLAWTLSCVCPMPWLERMVHYKDKARIATTADTCGLFSYPVLQAADILLFHATRVPVGEDQRQHLELARDLALAFNKRYGVQHFPSPVADFADSGAARIMSLGDAHKKMSKSSPAQHHVLYVDETPDDIRAKIKRAATDSHHGITYEPDRRPEVSNLLRIYSAFCPDNRTPEQVAQEFEHSEKANFKTKLADLLVEQLRPMREYVQKTPLEQVEEILKRGAENANQLAEPNIRKFRKIVGI